MQLHSPLSQCGQRGEGLENDAGWALDITTTINTITNTITTINAIITAVSLWG